MRGLLRNAAYRNAEDEQCLFSANVPRKYTYTTHKPDPTSTSTFFLFFLIITINNQHTIGTTPTTRALKRESVARLEGNNFFLSLLDFRNAVGQREITFQRRSIIIIIKR